MSNSDIRGRWYISSSEIKMRLEKNQEVKGFLYAFAIACVISMVMVVLNYTGII